MAKRIICIYIEKQNVRILIYLIIWYKDSHAYVYCFASIKTSMI
jgi:hypothetical protein